MALAAHIHNLAAILSVVFACSFARAQPELATASLSADHARAAEAALLRLYSQDTGLFTTTGWWNSANAVTALADESRITGDPGPRAVFPEILAHAPRRAPAFLNNYYDDEGWWALAWIDVYELDPHGAGAARYLQTASTIFEDMAGGWDDTCGGGIWWSKDRNYKNAIANELFLSVAARLASHATGERKRLLLSWANREWRWFSQTGMINPDHLINDGLDKACKNNGKTTWTYNQGVILGGLAALSRDEPQMKYVLAAQLIAISAISHLTDPQGVLHESCEPDCGEDGVSFKGIFNRNLAQLAAADPDPAFIHFLEVNAQSVWANARTPEDRFGVVWSGPPTGGNAAAQASALDALNAAASCLIPRKAQ